MADIELILEAERRGILPEDKKGLLAEARARGLVEAGEGGADGAPAPAKPGTDEAPEPGAGEYLLNRAKKGFAGFMGAPGDIADVLRDAPFAAGHPALIPFSILATQVAEKLGLRPSRETLPTERLIATSKTYQGAFGYDPAMKTENDALRYMGGISEMGAAGGPMLAASGVRAIPMVTSTMGAGIGLEAGGDVAEGIGLPRQAGEFTGAVAGGILPTLTGSATHGAVDWLKSRYSRSAQEASAQGAVNREVLPLVQHPASEANLKRSLEVSDEFAAAGREFSPSLPARTGSPGLLAMEQDLVTRNPQALERAVDRAQKNQNEITAFVNTQFPGGKQTSAQRIAGLQKQAGAKLEGIRAAIDDKLDDLATVFERNPNNYEVGRRVRDLVFKQKEVYRGISGQKYQATYEAADRLGVRANIEDVAQFADDALKSEFNAYQKSEIPPVFRELAQIVKKEVPQGGRSIPPDLMAEAQSAARKPAEVSFAELHSLYKRTNSDLASLRGSQSVDKGMKEHLLGQVKTQLEQKLAGFEDAGFGEVATKLKEANRFYREDYLPRFKQGFGDDVLARYSSGEFKVPNQSITALITKSNNAQAAKDFKLLFDDVPEAWQSLRDGYMDVLFRDKNVLNATGKVDQKILDRFLRQHSQTLDEFPQIRNEFKQLSLDNSALLERQARVMAAQKELAAADLYKLFNGKDPAIVVPEAVSNPNAMRLLVHKARNSPHEGTALARAIAEDVVKQADPVTYFTQNKETLRIGLQALGKDHFKNLETAIDAITINQRGGMPSSVQASGIAPDTFTEKLGSSPRALVSHYINVARGRTGLNQEATAFLGRWFDKLRRDHKTVAMEAVFYDKDVARAMSNLATQPKTTAKFRMDFVNAMATLGIRAEVAGQE